MQVATSHAPAALFGERLVKLGKLKPADLERALRAQAEIRQPLGSVLVRLGMLTEQEVAFVLSRHLNVRMALSKDYPSLPVENLGIAINYMRNAEIVPLQAEEERLVVAMSNPQDEFTCQAIGMASGKLVEPLLGLPTEIRANIERLYGGEASKQESGAGGDDEFEITSQDHNLDDIEHLKDMASEAPVIRLVNQIMTNAMTQRASDIHIEPFETHLKVRYRIDGVIHEVESPPPQLTAAIISRLKLMARLNIAERRLPQDGRIQLRAQGKEIDMRVSTVPTMHGESVVMRLLDKHSVKLDLNTLGFSDDNLRKVQQQLDAPHGVILVTGPTGSGKTTTLYSALTQLNTPENKVLTVEDPVEYELEGINQIQANPKIGLNFADALRSIVRQDPDIIMIGEMRDVETARIAIQSALTGHLVLSTLHTNDAASGITRLMDMGIEDYLITSTVNGILAQRLVRRLCPQCRESHPVLPEIEQELGLRHYQPEGELRLWHAKGCSACGNSGYKGRSAIHEVLVMDDPLRRLILKHEDAGVLQEQARKGGMRTMYEDGLYKALKGVTTLEEVLRVAEETPNAHV
ncbi:type II secretion system ATPase GspE [Thiothrix subterranea]|uniref:Type II secretion system protein E n=1 Tax=Thiothrix subterranea TaxID=2735563 RepID=A0AA51MNI6_9GAMM|nr:type II secretion system ATPase GspE [Thiothrix subterranea]MDQ5768397.1 type II secretion system ATPase GspE [Thiothrix subterranea]WML86984.1 type II secretion system ATPase GspE [Thiothrix subterranea]